MLVYTQEHAYSGLHYILPPVLKKSKKKNIRSMADLRQKKLTVNRVHVWGFWDKRKAHMQSIGGHVQSPFDRSCKLFLMKCLLFLPKSLHADG